METKKATLTRGVIYDEVDIDSIRNKMFDDMVPVSYMVESDVVDKFREESNLSHTDALDYMIRSDVIGALTRLDTETLETRNLIVPKECLSESLVRDLTKVDLAHDLNEYYGNRHYEEHCERNSVTPEEICEDVDGELIDAIKNGKRVVFVADKDMTVSQFKEGFTNFIKELEKAIIKTA